MLEHLAVIGRMHVVNDYLMTNVEEVCDLVERARAIYAEDARPYMFVFGTANFNREEIDPALQRQRHAAGTIDL